MHRSIPCLLLPVLMALSGCHTNPSTGRTQLMLVSSDETRQMGIEAMPEMVEEYGGEYPSAELRGYISGVGQTLLAYIEPEYEAEPWEFILLDSDVINAFALPGGKVFITVGLLSRMSNEAQVAGVLGHEIGHVTARHVDERLSQTIVAQIGLESLGLFTESELIVVGAELLTGGTLLKFNRDQEMEADRQGMKYMSRAHYDPAGMRQVMEVLRDAAAEAGGRSLEIFSTHPHPETRIEQIDELLATVYRATQNDPAYSVFEERFERDAEPYFPPPGEPAAAITAPADFCLVCRLQH